MKKKIELKQPRDRVDPEAVDQWVTHGTAPAAVSSPRVRASAPKGKPARLTIDLPSELHSRFKAACAIHKTRMIDEVRTFIEDWTQKHS